MTGILTLFNNIYPLSDQFATDLQEGIVQKSLPRKTMIVRQGRPPNNIYFIEKGIARAFYLKNDTDITSRFLRENELVIPLQNENIELLEDSVLLSIDHNHMLTLYKKFPELNFVMRSITEHYYILSEERSYSMRMKSARERYEELLQHDPQIFLRVPLKHIATYLGMKPETLSRIRAQR